MEESRCTSLSLLAVLLLLLLWPWHLAERVLQSQRLPYRDCDHKEALQLTGLCGSPGDAECVTQQLHPRLMSTSFAEMDGVQVGAEVLPKASLMPTLERANRSCPLSAVSFAFASEKGPPGQGNKAGRNVSSDLHLVLSFRCSGVSSHLLVPVTVGPVSCGLLQWLCTVAPTHMGGSCWKDESEMMQVRTKIVSPSLRCTTRIQEKASTSLDHCLLLCLAMTRCAAFTFQERRCTLYADEGTQPRTPGECHELASRSTQGLPTFEDQEFLERKPQTLDLGFQPQGAVSAHLLAGAPGLSFFGGSGAAEAYLYRYPGIRVCSSDFRAVSQRTPRSTVHLQPAHAQLAVKIDSTCSPQFCGNEGGASWWFCAVMLSFVASCLGRHLLMRRSVRQGLNRCTQQSERLCSSLLRAPSTDSGRKMFVKQFGGSFEYVCAEKIDQAWWDLAKIAVEQHPPAIQQVLERSLALAGWGVLEANWWQEEIFKLFCREGVLEETFPESLLDEVELSMEPSQRGERRGRELETLRRLNLCVWLLAAWLGVGLTSLLAFWGLFFGGLWPTLVVALSVTGFLLAQCLAAGLAQQKARSFARGPSGHSRSCGYDELLMRPAPTLLRLLKELLEVENKASCGSKDLEHSFQSFLPKLVAQNGLNLRLAQQVLESKWPECQVDRFTRACIYDHFYADMARQAVQQNSQALGLVNWSEIDDRDARKPSAKLSILEAALQQDGQLLDQAWEDPDLALPELLRQDHCHSQIMQLFEAAVVQDGSAFGSLLKRASEQPEIEAFLLTADSCHKASRLTSLMEKAMFYHPEGSHVLHQISANYELSPGKAHDIARAGSLAAHLRAGLGELGTKKACPGVCRNLPAAMLIVLAGAVLVISGRGAAGGLLTMAQGMASQIAAYSCVVYGLGWVHVLLLGLLVALLGQMAFDASGLCTWAKMRPDVSDSLLYCFFPLHILNFALSLLLSSLSLLTWAFSQTHACGLWSWPQADVDIAELVRGAVLGVACFEAVPLTLRRLCSQTAPTPVHLIQYASREGRIAQNMEERTLHEPGPMRRTVRLEVLEVSIKTYTGHWARWLLRWPTTLALELEALPELAGRRVQPSTFRTRCLNYLSFLGRTSSPGCCSCSAREEALAALTVEGDLDHFMLKIYEQGARTPRWTKAYPWTRKYADALEANKAEWIEVVELDDLGPQRSILYDRWYFFFGVRTGEFPARVKIKVQQTLTPGMPSSIKQVRPVTTTRQTIVTTKFGDWTTT